MLELLGVYDVDKKLRLLGIPQADIKARDYGTVVRFSLKDEKYEFECSHDTFIESRYRYVGIGIGHVYHYYESDVIHSETHKVAGRIRYYRFYISTRPISSDSQVFPDVRVNYEGKNKWGTLSAAKT